MVHVVLQRVGGRVQGLNSQFIQMPPELLESRLRIEAAARSQDAQMVANAAFLSLRPSKHFAQLTLRSFARYAREERAHPPNVPHVKLRGQGRAPLRPAARRLPPRRLASAHMQLAADVTPRGLC